MFEFEPREATADDMGYVFSTLEASLRKEYRTASNADFAAACRELISSELTKGAQLLVAGTSSSLWGWCLVRAGVVVYVYVRARYRGARIATRLLAAAGIDTADTISVRIVTPLLLSIVGRSRVRVRHRPVL